MQLLQHAERGVLRGESPFMEAWKPAETRFTLQQK